MTKPDVVKPLRGMPSTTQAVDHALRVREPTVSGVDDPKTNGLAC